jgi:hypothetical protein
MPKEVILCGKRDFDLVCVGVNLGNKIITDL